MKKYRTKRTPLGDERNQLLVKILLMLAVLAYMLVSLNR
jgi:hypothetical protein